MLITILIFLTGITVMLAGGAAGIVLLGENTVIMWRQNGTYPGLWGYLLNAVVYMMLGGGLVLSVVAAVSGALLCILSLIFKSWIRALLSAGGCFAALAIWKFLMECSL